MTDAELKAIKKKHGGALTVSQALTALQEPYDEGDLCVLIDRRVYVSELIQVIQSLRADLARLRGERDKAREIADSLYAKDRQSRQERTEDRAAIRAAHDKLVATYKVRNIIDEDICDLCGGDLKWPEHKPECEIGQVLAILAPAIRRATQEEGNGCAL